MEKLPTIHSELRWDCSFLTATTMSRITQFLLNSTRKYCYGGRNFVKRLPLKTIGKP